MGCSTATPTWDCDNSMQDNYPQLWKFCILKVASVCDLGCIQAVQILEILMQGNFKQFSPPNPNDSARSWQIPRTYIQTIQPESFVALMLGDITLKGRRDI